MSINLSALMKQRYDTAANWTAQNPTLLAGEIGIESDTKRWKIGSGSTAWTSLTYANGSTYPFVNADIAAGAEIAVSKLADGSARQLLQTDAAGTGVEWTSDVSIPGVLAVTAGTAALPGIAVSGDLNTGITSPGADQLAISTGGTSRLAVSTTAVSSTLAVDHPLGAAATPSITFTGDLNTGIYSPGADQLAIATGGVGKFFVNASGNVGIGITPSIFTVGQAIEIGQVGNALFGATSGQLNLMQNAYYNADFKYANTAAASYYQQLSGAHIWHTASSGTAGNTISFSELARIDSSGRLLVGGSPDSGGALLQVFGDRIRVGTAKTPASASATGTAGEICWDASYIYVCTATNTWKRTAIATW